MHRARRLPRFVLFAAMAWLVHTLYACADGAQQADPTPSRTAPRTAGAPSPSTGRNGPSVAVSPSLRQPTPSATDPATTTGAELIAAAAHPLTGRRDEYDELVAYLGRADVVLLGEPSHGTLEVYEERAELTRRLIEEEGFAGLVIEGDWPEAWRVDRYVRGIGDDSSPAEALGDFDEYPLWMWRNESFAELVGWLREHNSALPYERRAGVYGMDLYSLPESIAAVEPELDAIDPAAAARAARRYACAGPSGTDDAHEEGPSCAEHVRAALREALRVAAGIAPTDIEQADRAFSAAQNARIVVNGRRYAIGEGGATEPSWNIRDRHMAETLWALRDHLARTGRGGRLVVWAHNSHVGDARATDVASHGQLNVGQLVREQPGVRSAIVGFSTYTGTVTASESWGDQAETMKIVPAVPESHHALLHEAAGIGPDDFLVFLGDRAPEPLHDERLERYIGVIYRPRSERQSHYIESRIADEYDVLVHLDETTAVEPLD